MTIGEKIKYIRIFRGMTQQQLGVAIGLSAKGADNRMAQYETNYRVPKKDMLEDIAEALDVNSLNFISPVSGSAEDIMQTFFWTRTIRRHCISFRWFRVKRNTEREMPSKHSMTITMICPLSRLSACGSITVP